MLKSDNFDELLEQGKRDQHEEQEYEEQIHDKVFNSASEPQMSVAEAYRKGQEALEKETVGAPANDKAVGVKRAVEVPKPAAVIKPVSEKEKNENKLCPNFPGGEGEKCPHASPIGLDQKKDTKLDVTKPISTLQKFDQLKVTNSAKKTEDAKIEKILAKPKMSKEEIIEERQNN